MTENEERILSYLGGCILEINTLEQVSDLGSAHGLLSAVAAESGWNARALGQSSTLRSEREADSPKLPQILIVEDNESDVFLIREAIAFAEVSAALQVLRDGSEAIEFILATERDENAGCPDLMLLDLNLPRKSGNEVLRRVRESPKCQAMRVLIVTSSSAARDRENMQVLKADGYFRKPSEYAEFLKLGDVVKSLLPKYD